MALARLCDFRCKKSEAEIAKALRGDWREEHLFTLRQSLEAPGASTSGQAGRGRL